MKEKGEDVTMCTLLDYAENKGVQRGIHEGIETGICAMIEAFQEFGQPYELTMEKVMEKFQLDSQEAAGRMQRYWID